MFLQAGFNARNRDTGIRGWTRHLRDPLRRFERAGLRQFIPSGDYFWYGELRGGGAFLSNGEQVVLGTYHAFELAWEYQNGLAYCDIDTREVHPPWGDKRRAALDEGIDPDA